MTLLFWVLFSVIVSGACSIFETVLLSARPMHLLEKRNQSGVSLFLEIKEERIGDAISAILTVNTVACTVGPGFVGAEAARIWGDPAVAIASAVLTFLLLILSEIGPKTYAATHAEDLAGVTGRTLRPLLWLLAPVLAITRWLTRWLSGDSKGYVTRNSLARIIAHAPSQGALSHGESDVLSHILFAHQITLADAHTPLAFVVALPEAAAAAALLDDGADLHFARIPIYGDNPEHLSGYINQREVLREALRDSSIRRKPLSAFGHALPKLEDSLPVGQAIAKLLDAREPIGAVVKNGEVVGITTLEDLFEALLGVDITDEAEEVAAQRSEADMRRRDRIRRLRNRRRQWTGDASSEATAET